MLKVAIVTRPDFRSPRYLAIGLQRMLRREGVVATCFLHGMLCLMALRDRFASRRHRLMALVAMTWLRRLKRYDVIVVADTVDIAGQSELLAPLRQLGKPMLMYEVFALHGSRYWLERLPATALNQFDAWLVSSAIHDDKPAPGPPIFEIGLELLEPPTQSSSKPFMAMLDFEREGYEEERLVQERALRLAGVPKFTLAGEYSFSEIVAEYERAACAFVAFPEAFGVPIAQLQNRRSLIIAPKRRWANRHALMRAGSVFDEGAPFTENFVFYEDDDELAERLRKATTDHCPRLVAQAFSNAQPHLAHGNASELRRPLAWAGDWRA